MQHERITSQLVLAVIVSIGIIGTGLNEAYAVVPLFDTYVADDPDNGDIVFSNGDTITINFDSATNATGNGLISQAEINANFTDGAGAPDFGTTYSGVWSAGSTSLVITVTDVTGHNLFIGVDTIAGTAGTNIAGIAGTNADLISIGGDTATLSGDFGVIAAPAASGGGGSVPQGGVSKPTMGVNKYGHVLVEDGFSYNNNPVDVALLKTDFPLVTTIVGEENVIELKIYSKRGPDNIRHVAVGFGLAKGKIFGESNVVIEWDKSWDGKKTLNIIDPENYLADNVSVVSHKGKCKESSYDEKCLTVKIFHTFRKPLEYKIIGMSMWDDKRSSSQSYFNDGVKIQGESMDPPAQYQGVHKGKSITITETGKNTAIDENDNTWTFDKSWKMDYIPQSKIDKGVTSHLYDRNSVLFNAYKQGQSLLAQKTLQTSEDGKLMKPKILEDPTFYEIDFISRSDDVKLQKLIENQKDIADKWFADNFVVDANDEFNKYLKIHQQFREQISRN